MANKQYKKDIQMEKMLARQIIERVGGPGEPPEYGFQYYTVGLDGYLNTIEEEYFKTLIKGGGAAFKMVIGMYGGGKTHFLYCNRELAWKYNYMTSYIILSVEQTPFHKLEQVYKAVVSNLVYPQSQGERGIEAVIEAWYNQKFREFSKKVSEDLIEEELNTYASKLGPYESTSFKNAIKEAFLSLMKKSKEKTENFTLITQWLKGENPPKDMLKKFMIFEKIDKSTAFRMMRSLVQWIRAIGYSGLIVFMDEAEQTPSMSSKQKSLLLNNLRELIDECGHLNFRNTMFFYAVPDENFLEGKTQIYEALRQRVSNIFDEEINPTGVKIYLEKIPIKPEAMLTEIGKKLAQIYEIAYDVEFDPSNLEETITNIAKDAYERKFEVGYKRFFVQNIITAYHKLRKTGKPVSPSDIEL